MDSGKKLTMIIMLVTGGLLLILGIIANDDGASLAGSIWGVGGLLLMWMPDKERK